ncbi:hypothetical protein ACRQ5Q_07320 [Bradyrhizobium sp. PMVTL-01]|uniref:hypothetical protein n=1 Tax=Bradyrhizobium sp. PMVTL-01 TaxID=3434999 RepID=UPI003F72834A
MTKPAHPFRTARIERLVELLEADYRVAVDPNTNERNTKSEASDPEVLDCQALPGPNPGGCEQARSLRANPTAWRSRKAVDTPEEAITIWNGAATS